MEKETEKKAFSKFSFDLTLFIFVGILMIVTILNGQWIWSGLFTLTTIIMGFGSYVSYDNYKNLKEENEP